MTDSLMPTQPPATAAPPDPAPATTQPAQSAQSAEPVQPVQPAQPVPTEALSLAGAIEALLFVSDEPVSVPTLAKVLKAPAADIDSTLALLATRFAEEERGIQLREVAGGWRLYTHPAYHELIEEYVLSWDTRSLSQAALEALAVVAYHQPATRAAVNGIRGVNSEGVISSLIEKGLVREMGRDSSPGNPILYGTTRTFLEKFGLKSLRELPPLEDFAPDEQSRAFIRERLSARQQAPDEIDFDAEREDEEQYAAYDYDLDDAPDGEQEAAHAQAPDGDPDDIPTID